VGHRLFIIVLGAVSITQLPVAQYPPVAPPTIVLSAAYPGASAQTWKTPCCRSSSAR
jgi:multidrug efflux pump